LCFRVYQETYAWEKCEEFTNRLYNWKLLRDRKELGENSDETFFESGNSQPIAKIVSNVLREEEDEAMPELLAS
jgi:hypothetical protein